MSTTNLTVQQLDDLRDAARNNSAFIEPYELHTVQYAEFRKEWAEEIIGRPYRGLSRLKTWEVSALFLALRADPGGARPGPAQVREEAARKQAARAARAVTPVEAGSALRGYVRDHVAAQRVGYLGRARASQMLPQLERLVQECRVVAEGGADDA